MRKEKSIYHTLNMLSLDVTKKCLVAEGWSPVFGTKLVFFSFCYISIKQTFQLWYTGYVFYLDTQTWLAWLLQIQDALQRASFDSNSQVGAIFQVLQTKELPPTYFRTNKFTSPFQEIVDAYGWVSL